MKHDFKVQCLTCGQLFLSHTFRPSKWWYFTAARHFLENPNHEIVWFQRFDQELDINLDIVFLSQQWRRVGIPNLLQEIRDLKERFRIAELNEELEKQRGVGGQLNE